MAEVQPARTSHRSGPGATSPNLEFGGEDFDKLPQARYQITYGLWDVGGDRAAFFGAGPGKDLSTATPLVKDGAGEPTVLLDACPRADSLLRQTRGDAERGDDRRHRWHSAK